MEPPHQKLVVMSDTRALREHWTKAWQTLGVAPAESLLEQLLSAYSQPARHYHTLSHLQHCMREFSDVTALCQHPDEVALALFFHDAVYDVRSLVPQANETASAQWAQRALQTAGCDDSAVNGVTALVMATCHGGTPKGTAETAHPDQDLLVDIDLAILGQPTARFLAYEDEVRLEYSWVPEAAFKAGRLKVLDEFLEAEAVYRTRHFKQRYEARAQKNLRASTATLSR